ncbi:hypothetical protein VTN02DRAFT_3092 [Thermoascus thermophilus]
MGKRRASAKRNHKKTVSVANISTRSMPKRSSDRSETCSEKGKLRWRSSSPMKVSKIGKEKTASKITDIKASAGYRENETLANKELVNDFSDSLQTTRLEIAEDTKTFLSRAETELQHHLEKTIRLYANDLSFSRHKEIAILAPLGVETHLAVGSRRTGCQDGSLGGLVAEIHDSLHTHGSNINELWKEWSKIQQELVRLGSGALGSSHFNNIQPSNQSASTRELQSTMVLNESLEGHKTELYNLIHGQKGKIKDLTQKAVGKSKAQTKVWKAEERKYWEVMGDLAQKLAARS